MKLEIAHKGRYQILKIREELTVISDLFEVQKIIDHYLAQGRIYIAVSFTDTSYVYSGAIAALVGCIKKVMDAGGDLCLIEPNEDIYTVFNIVGVTRIIDVYKSENDLPGDEEQG